MRNFILTFGAIGGAAAAELLGGWDSALQTLIIFMAVDYLSGVACAAFFKCSSKSENGGLSSKSGFKGLAKKGMQLAIVLIAHRLDVMTGGDIVRTAVIIGFTANECISIIENACLMGVPIPAKLRQAVDLIAVK